MSDKVERYYDRKVRDEWERLERHRTEFALTLRALQRHLPSAARVLDVGGGPGRYALTLAERGHRVTLFDLSRQSLELAGQLAEERGVALEDRVQGTATDLSRWPNAHFDAVLMLGPLYHLLADPERASAVREALRVLKPGGILFASVIVRWAVLRNLAAFEPERLLDYLPKVEAHLATGVFETGPNSAFVDFYGFHPFDVAPWLESFGLRTIEVIGQEGLVSEMEDKVNSLAGPAWEAWVEINERAGRDPSLWGQCQHLLYVGRKEAPRLRLNGSARPARAQFGSAHGDGAPARGAQRVSR